MKPDIAGMILAGAAAGAVTGVFGAGGGMVLVPLLAKMTDLEERQHFSASVSIMAPICLTALLLKAGSLPWSEALPYLLGSALGGVLAGVLGRKVPTRWLHRILGGLILWGGWRYLWS